MHEEKEGGAGFHNIVTNRSLFSRQRETSFEAPELYIL